MLRDAVKAGLQRVSLLEFAKETLSEFKALKYMRGNVKFWIGREWRKETLPIPPLRMIYLVAGDFEINWFLSSGRSCCQNIQNILKKHRIDVLDFEKILDFGCGCGRVTRHWKGPMQVYGSDYNEKLIQWCKSHLTFAHFATNGLEPPLLYQDETFGFIYAISVFTHLPEDLQLRWMKEFSRVLKPGGYLLFTTHGESYLNQLSEEEQRRFKAGELIVKNETSSGKNLCSSFQSETHIRRLLGNGFEVVDFIPNGDTIQDVSFLRKRASNVHGDTETRSS